MSSNGIKWIRYLHSVDCNKGKWLMPNNLFCSTPFHSAGWSGGAIVLGKLPVLRRPTIRIIVGQGPIALAVGGGVGCFGHFYSFIFSLLFLPLSGRWPDID